MYRIKNIHFVGIGGSGMSGIAEVLLTENYTVSGSDPVRSDTTRKLEQLGAKIFFEHRAENISDADVLVVSSAIADDNVEVIAARQKRIPILRRAEMLAELMRFHHGIAVSGTHGKTTTTSLIAALLSEGGLAPTYVIGGILNSTGSHAKRGVSRYFVAEADESDASFLYLNPTMVVVTNIDADHMGTYQDNFQNLKKAFLDFIHRLPFYGLAVLNLDDPVVCEILPQVSRPVITYGFNENADIRAFDFRQEGLTTYFRVKIKNQDELLIQLNLPGIHNASNTLAAIAIAKECGVSNQLIIKALQEFRGVKRRIEVRGELQISKGKALLIDDYGHHPKEIAATIKAIKNAWPQRRLVHVFQPHRYTRLKSLFADFVKVLTSAEQTVLLDIYSAGEKPIAGYDGRTLFNALQKEKPESTVFISKLEDLPAQLGNLLQNDDILLLQGAGSIGTWVEKISKAFNL
jgi:UDP-N-acetylmuramate--alanine ligase